MKVIVEPEKDVFMPILYCGGGGRKKGYSYE